MVPGTDFCSGHQALPLTSADVLHCLCSVEFRLRFPGSDLWSGHKALPYEVSLMFLLLGAVYVHHLPQLLGQVGVAPSLLESAPQHIAATVLVLLLPGAVAATTDGLMRITAGSLQFTKSNRGYVILFCLLAMHTENIVAFAFVHGLGCSTGQLMLLMLWGYHCQEQCLQQWGSRAYMPPTPTPAQVCAWEAI